MWNQSTIEMNKLFETLAPPLITNFEELLTADKIGLYPMLPKDIIAIKFYLVDDNHYGYHYTLQIPYAGVRLTWDLIFDPNDMNFSPDFYFQDLSFQTNTDLEIVTANVPTWSNWDRNNPKSLTNLLKEFLELYKNNQVDLLNCRFARLKSEYETLIQEKSPDDVEIYFNQPHVHFLIRLEVDVSALPNYLEIADWNTGEMFNPGDERCFVRLNRNLPASYVDPFLQLSLRLEKMIGDSETLRIPNYTKTTTLSGYVKRISKIIEDHITNAKRFYEHKQTFVISMFTMFAGNVIEFEAETFSEVLLFCKVDANQCLVSVELTGEFPDEKPIVTLLSIDRLPPKKMYCDYLYSPTWSSEEMIEKMMLGLTVAIPKFQNRN